MRTAVRINLLTSQSCLLVRVTMRVLCADMRVDQLTAEVEATESDSFLTTSKALDCMPGYVKDGHVTVGVHISVPVTDAVISSKLHAPF